MPFDWSRGILLPVQTIHVSVIRSVPARKHKLRYNPYQNCWVTGNADETQCIGVGDQRRVICTRRPQDRPVLKLIKGLHHVGVAVSNLDEALKTYRTTLGLEPRFVKEVNDQKIRVASIKLGESSLELFEPTDPSSTLTTFLAKRGEGIHHVALAVDDIRATLNAAQKAGATAIDREPRVGAEGQLIAFLHPKSTRGTLVELCQE